MNPLSDFFNISHLFYPQLNEEAKTDEIEGSFQPLEQETQTFEMEETKTDEIELTVSQPLAEWIDWAKKDIASLPPIPFRLDDGILSLSPFDFHLLLQHSDYLQEIVSGGNFLYNKDFVSLESFTTESLIQGLALLKRKTITPSHLSDGSAACLERLSLTGKIVFKVDPIFFTSDLVIEDISQVYLPVSIEVLFETVSSLSKLACFPLAKKLNFSSCLFADNFDFSPIASLSSLKELKLSRAKVTALSLSWIEKLNSLEVLNLSECWKIEGFPSIARLKRLKELNISYTKVTDLSWMEELNSLEALNLFGCRLVKDFSEVARLNNLKRLDLSMTNVTGFSWIEELNSLEVLNLYSCKQIEEFSEIARSKSLKKLVLSDTDVTTLSWIAEFNSLEILDLSYCEQVFDFSPTAHLERLKELNISYTNVTDISWIGQIQSLEILDLSHCSQIEDLFPDIRLRYSGKIELRL